MHVKLLTLIIWCNIYNCTFQQIPKRPETPKVKQPDDYDFDDPELERDYRKMYDTLQEMEAEKAERDGENIDEDPNKLKKEMEAALLFGGVK